MPYVVHDVQLLAAALIEVSEHQEFNKKPMEFIKVALLRVYGIAEDPKHEVIGGEEVVGTPAHRPSNEVEVDHLFLLHMLVGEVNPEGVEVVGGDEFIAETLCQILTLSLHEVLLGHPSKRVDAILSNVELDGGIELAYDLLGEWMVEIHQGNEPQFFTYFLGLSEVFGLGIKFLQVDIELRATRKFLDAIYFIIDPLLVLVVEVWIGAQEYILLDHIQIDIVNLQELVLGQLVHRLDRSRGSLLLGCRCLLSLGGARREGFFFNLALATRDGEVRLLWSPRLRTCKQQKL
jgi:hypothetical protein